LVPVVSRKLGARDWRRRKITVKEGHLSAAKVIWY
jgi:hypothetical protein